MQTKEWRFIDKSAWGPGQWQDEPDKAQWPDPTTGLPCLAVRHPTLGHWCGYVGVASDHRLFEQPYDAVDVTVHGGLTFADHCQPGKQEHGICHIPDDGEPDHVWWLGFDCAHLGDLNPGMRRYKITGFDHSERYRTLDYIKEECASLARQIKLA